MRPYRNNDIFTPLAALATGAALMYFFDPARGRTRRARLRDKAYSKSLHLQDMVDKASRDMANHARGIAARTAHAFSHEDEVDNDVLVARVRSNMGRSISHPKAVHVAAHDGHITLSGPIFTDEADTLLRIARKTPGVQDVTDNLERHDTPGNIPALQHGHTVEHPSLSFAPRDYTPATRLICTLTGAGLAAYGLAHPKNPASATLGILGVVTVAWGLADPHSAWGSLGSTRNSHPSPTDDQPHPQPRGRPSPVDRNADDYGDTIDQVLGPISSGPAI